MEVKKLLQNDFQATLARYQIIKSARLYREQIAIAALNAGTNIVSHPGEEVNFYGNSEKPQKEPEAAAVGCILMKLW